MKTRTEIYGNKRTPCLVIADGRRETWVSIEKVKAVLAVPDEAKAFLASHTKPVAAKAPDLAAQVAALQAQITALTIATLPTPSRVDPIAAHAAPAVVPSAESKPASKLDALVAKVQQQAA